MYRKLHTSDGTMNAEVMKMRDDVFIYTVDLQGKARAMAMPCIEGYTVYVDRNLSPDQQIEAARHELDHISHADFEKTDVQEIERKRHGKGKEDAVRKMEDTAGRKGTADLHHRRLEAGG